LGIGGFTIAVSIADAAALRPLPYDEPSQLVSVWLQATGTGAEQRAGLTGADLAALRAEPGLFGALSGWRSRTVVLAGPEVSEIVDVAAVSEGMFSRVLRVRPLLGRTFLPEEDVPGHPPPVLLSHLLWVERFASSPEALGRSLVLDGEPHIVVGVMPAAFRPPFAAQARLWVPARIEAEPCGACRRLAALARLAPGTTATVAQDRASAVAKRLAEAQPTRGADLDVRVLELARDRPLAPAGTLRAALLAGFVMLLVACVNVAFLLGARIRRRSREMDIRAAAGATAGSILRLHIVESLVLAAVGGVMGVGLATWAAEMLILLAPAAHPGLEQIRPAGRSLLIAVGVTASAAVAFGSVAALLTRPAGVGTAARERWAWRGSRSTDRLLALSSAVLTAQVALAMMLAVSAGASREKLAATAPPEIETDPGGLLAVDVSLPPTRYADPVRRGRAVQAIEARLEGLPGVIAVGSIDALPMRPAERDAAVAVVPRPDVREEVPSMRLHRVSESFFYVAGRRIVEGRTFELPDERERPLVAVLNQTAAELIFGEGSSSAVGARITVREAAGPTPRTIIGVVRDAGGRGQAAVRDAVVYLPMTQAPVLRATLLARVAEGGVGGAAWADEARAAVAAVDPGAAVARIGRLDARVEAAFSRERFVATVLTVLAAAMLVLAGLGLFAFLSYEVTRHAAGLAVRHAVGADRDDLRRSVRWHALFPATSGAVLGAAGAWILLSSVGAFVVDETGVASQGVYLSAAALVVGVALMAAVGPGRSAAGLEVVPLLRTE